MVKTKKLNKKALAAAISLALVAIIAIAIIFVYGAEEYGTVTVTFSDGKNNVVFENVERSADKSISNCIVVPGESFAKTVTVKLDNSHKFDCETFYFDENITDETRAYTFTGWYIVGADEKIPGKTVFQPGDTITPEVLEKYASDGSLELEALW